MNTHKFNKVQLLSLCSKIPVSQETSKTRPPPPHGLQREREIGIQKFLLENPFISLCTSEVPASMLVISDASCATSDKASTPESRSSRKHRTVFVVFAESAKSSSSNNFLSETSPTCKNTKQGANLESKLGETKTYFTFFQRCISRHHR